MSSPAFAILGLLEEAVDEPGPRVGIGIINKVFDVLWGGWKAEEVEVGAANEGTAIGSGVGCQAGSLLLCENKVIDGIAAPAVVFDVGYGGGLQGLEGPEFSVLIGNDHFGGGFGGAISERFVVGGAEVDPGAELFNFCLRKFGFFPGHVRFGFVSDDLEEVAISGGVAEETTGDERFAGGEVEIGFHGVATVAVEAAAGEDLADGGAEEFEAFFSAFGVVGGNLRSGFGGRGFGRFVGEKGNGGMQGKSADEEDEAENVHGRRLCGGWERDADVGVAPWNFNGVCRKTQMDSAGVFWVGADSGQSGCNVQRGLSRQISGLKPMRIPRDSAGIC